MIYLKKANLEDAAKEYELTQKIREDDIHYYTRITL